MTKNIFILNFLRLYNILWKLVLPFLAKNKRLKPGFQKRVSALHHTKADIWIQAASAGEAYLAVQIITNLVPKTPLKVLATTITTQGMDILAAELTKQKIHNNISLSVEWFPFDTPSTMKQAVAIINPTIMILLETEIWPALFWFLKQNKTKIYIVNARLSAKSFSHYRKTKFLWKHLSPDSILATSNIDAKRYEQIFETTDICTMSNIKFESMNMDSPKDAPHKQIIKLVSSSLPLTVLASVRKQEEKQIICLLKGILDEYPDQIVAIFPRHMHRIKPWEMHLAALNYNYQLRSQISDSVKKPQIILWDTFGELKAVYDFAHVVFVGASLVPLGGQNFIEPAILGAITVTGPYCDDFEWACDAISKEDIVVQKNDWREIKNFIVNSLTTKDKIGRIHRKEKVFKYIQTHKGGTLRVCNKILKAFDE